MRSVVYCSLFVLLMGVPALSYAYDEDRSDYPYPYNNADNMAYNSSHHHHRAHASHASHRRSYPFPQERPATGRAVFIYNPSSLSWGAYNASGHLVRTGPGSGGSNFCSDLGHRCHSPVGVYRIFAKEGPGYRSTRFPLPNGGAPMPYAMFFHRGFAVHGSYEVRSFNASHGCIRIPPEDARWLSHNLLNYGSTVIIESY